MTSRWWLRGPAGIVVAAAVLVSVGIGAGIVFGRRTPEPPGVRHNGPAVPAMPGGRAASPELQSAAREIEREDTPTPRLLELAHLAFDQQQFGLAIPAYRRVLARDPKNAEALTHMGLILYRANHVDQALARIDEALRSDPTYAHAHWDRAFILHETKKDPGGAAKSIEAFLALVPKGPDADRARALLAEIRRTGATPKP